MTGLARTRRKLLKIGDITVANPVLLAPMSGVTDAPFRRLAASLGAGLVVSEMTASDDLALGRPMSVLRCEATGIGPHVVQLAGCETRWMARRVLVPAYALLVLAASVASAEWIQPQPLLAIAVGASAVLTPIWLLSGPRNGYRLIAVIALLAPFWWGMGLLAVALVGDISPSRRVRDVHSARGR